MYLYATRASSGFITGWTCWSGLEHIRGYIYVSSKRLLTRQSSDTGELLAFEQFERGSAASRHMAKLVLDLVLGSHSCGITTTDDDGLTVLRGVDGGVESGLGTGCEGIEPNLVVSDCSKEVTD